MVWIRDFVDESLKGHVIYTCHPQLMYVALEYFIDYRFWRIHINHPVAWLI